MATIGELARIGKENYTRKIPGMHKSYAAAAGRAQAGFDATPFGPTAHLVRGKSKGKLPFGVDRDARSLHRQGHNRRS